MNFYSVRDLRTTPKSIWENLSSDGEVFETYGYSILAEPSEVDFIDESDKKFFEVATSCGAVLVTGNLKHFPPDPLVKSVSDFLKEKELLIQKEKRQPKM